MALPLANPLTHERSNSTQTSIGAPRLICLWHLSSFDAPTVAVVWSLAFAWVANVRLPAWVPLLIALGTWAVYIGDRLLDARNGLRTGRLDRLRERHYFHWRHRRALLVAAVGAAAAAAATIFSLMPVGVRNRDSILAAAALAYFTGVHCGGNKPAWTQAVFSKECLVGILFTAGCAVPAISRVSFESDTARQGWSLLIVFAMYAALAWLNCCAIEAWESEGVSRVRFCAVAVAACSLLLAACIAQGEPRGALLLSAASVSAWLLLLLDYLRGRLTPLALRAAADLVLLTPVLLVSLAARVA